MRRQFLSTVGAGIIGLAYGVVAVQPNYVETTIHHVNSDPVLDIKTVSTEYSDGLGRGIQSKMKIAADKDLVSCTFYDAAGRPFVGTKTFIDNQKTGEFLPGDINDASVINQLKASNFNDGRAFSQTEYWDDPLGRVKRVKGPGLAFDGYEPRSWTFGVALQATEESIPVINGGATYDTLLFLHGLLTAISSADVEGCLDQFHANSLSANQFTTLPDHFLTINLSYDDESGTKEEFISEELKDKFGRTIRTLSSPTINSRTGKKVIAQYTHDILGNVLVETPPKDSSTVLIDSSEYKYNTLGRLIWKKTPDGGEFEYNHRDDGQLNNVLSYVGLAKKLIRKIQYNYDDLGRLKYIFSLYEGDLGEVFYEQVRYFYDDLSIIKTRSVFDPVTQWYRDKLTNLKGRLAGSETSNYVNGNRISVGELYSYDDEGRIKSKYVAMSGSPLFQETYYTYDMHGKVLFEAFYYGGADNILKRFTYDYLGRLSIVDHGKQKNDDTTIEYTPLVKMTYDDLGRTSDKELSAINGAYKTVYAYDILDRITDVTSGKNMGLDSETVKFTEAVWKYDAGGGVSASGFTKGGAIKNVRYHYGVNTPQTFDYRYDYDDLNRLSASAKSVGGSVAENNNYDYDKAGRFRVKQEGGSNLTGYAYYGGTSRLKATSKNADPNDANAYIYDKHGNLVVDFTKKMVIEYDWRDLPVAFRFYNDLSAAGLTKDSRGTYSGTDLYADMSGKVNDPAAGIDLVSTVVMIYDADGNRVCKMDVKE